MVILGYHESYISECQDYREKIQKEILKAGIQQNNALCESILKVVIMSNTLKRKGDKKVKLSFKPTKETEGILEYIECSVAGEEESLQQYIARMIEHYCEKPFSERERIVFKKNYGLLIDACSLNQRVSFSLIWSPDKRHDVIPYRVAIGKEEMYNYLLCAEINEKNHFIYNHTNAGDFVPEVPPTRAGWNYRKFGETTPFDVDAEMKIKYKEYRGEDYTGLSKDERVQLINAFCNAGKDKYSYGNHILTALNPSTNMIFTAKEYCQLGLAMAMIQPIEKGGTEDEIIERFKKNPDKVIGVSFMIGASISPGTVVDTSTGLRINPLALLTGHLVKDQVLNPKVAPAHNMEAYLAFADVYQGK